MTIQSLHGKHSGLFQPLTISNGKITLEHRVVHAPLTRNRGEPLHPSTPDNPNRIWVPGDVVVEYYAQRATKGGLMISEGIPPSLEVSSPIYGFDFCQISF
jgi:2,4-dienoyl-CoA reductase-like NADH-dependent reductase (Old Yellow Enzyme family)